MKRAEKSGFDRSVCSYFYDLLIPTSRAVRFWHTEKKEIKKKKKLVWRYLLQVLILKEKIDKFCT